MAEDIENVTELLRKEKVYALYQHSLESCLHGDDNYNCSIMIHPFINSSIH